MRMGLRDRDGHGHRVRLESHATVLLVEDVRRSTDYYRDKLGFDVERYASLRDHHGYARRGDCYVRFARFDGDPDGYILAFGQHRTEGS